MEFGGTNFYIIFNMINVLIVSALYETTLNTLKLNVELFSL